MSSAKFSISSAEGGSPIKSKYTRRNNVNRLAEGTGAKVLCSSLESTNASMGFFTHELFFGVGGGTGRIE